MGTKRSINSSAENTFIYSEDTNKQLSKIYEKFSMGTQAWILTESVLSLTMTKDNP